MNDHYKYERLYGIYSKINDEMKYLFENIGFSDG